MFFLSVVNIQKDYFDMANFNENFVAVTLEV